MRMLLHLSLSAGLLPALLYPGTEAKYERWRKLLLDDKREHKS